ncbi:hypothetical protein [Microbispora rosea]
MGSNQRRARWWRIQPYLGGGRNEALDLELEMEQDPYGGPVPAVPVPEKELQRLRDEARRHGARDGSSGMYDEWSLATGSRPPYLMMLDARCRQVVADEEVRKLRDAHRLDQRIAAAKQDLKLYEERARRTQERLATVREAEERLEKMLDGAPEEAGTGAGRWAEATRSFGRRRAGAAARALVIALFAGVELPIQYATFLSFGESREMTWAFVLGTVGAMMVAPHLAGGWTRRLCVEGRRSVLLVTTALVALAWVTGVVLLASLRTDVLFAPTVDSVTLEKAASAIEGLGLGHTIVTLLFTALLLLSGVVTFSFGYLAENPYAAKLADVQRVRAKLEKSLDRAVGERDKNQHLVGLETTLKERHAQRWEARIAARASTFEVCSALYLQAVAETMRNPAFTESASQWLKTPAL